MTSIKYVAILVLVIFYARYSYAQQGFILNGRLSKTEKRSYVLLKCNENGKAVIIDSAMIKNGRFQLHGYIEKQPKFYFLFVSNNKTYLPLFLDNSKVNIKGSMNTWPDVSVEGSLAHNDFMSFKKWIQPIEYNRKELINQKNNALKERNNEIASKLTRDISTADSLINLQMQKYISSNPNSFYSPVLILEGNFTLGAKIDLMSSLTYTVQKSFYGTLLKNRITELESLKIGGKAPDIVATNPDGNDISLYNVVAQSKLVLIDFWASWCKPCRAEHPLYKRAYDEFHNKGFTIISVSWDTKKNEWLKAIKMDELNWYNISDLKGPFSEIFQLYNVEGVPQNFLLNAEGKIIAVNLKGINVFEKAKQILNN